MSANRDHRRAAGIAVAAATLAVSLAATAVCGAVALAAGQFIPDIQATVEGGRRPMVIGKANLPDQTRLQVTVDGPNYEGQDFSTIVSGGSFRAGPFSCSECRETDLAPGAYTIEIRVTIGGLQPASVHAIVGEHGENLAGPLIVCERDPTPGSSGVIDCFALTTLHYQVQ